VPPSGFCASSTTVTLGGTLVFITSEGLLLAEGPSRDATALNALARLFGPYFRIPGGKAMPTAIKSSPSREILRATEALQDDKLHTVSNFSMIRFADKPV
jgi:hypothetical protein